MKYIVLPLLIFLLSFSLIIPARAAVQDVVITEIGAYEGTDYEWLEIYNRGSAPIDLMGWKFVENFTDSNPDGTNHNLNFSDSSVINFGQYAIIAQNSAKFKEKYPAFSGVLIDSSWSTLNESGEKIGLKNADGNFVEIFTYIEAKNFSLERKDHALNDYTAANWQEHPSGNTVGTLNFASQNLAQNNNQQAQETQQTNSESTITNIQNQNSNPPISGQASNITADAGENIIAIIGQEITFDASKSQGSITSYEWNFGDGQTSKEKIAKHKYNFAGKYIATLTISDGQNKSQTQIMATIYPTGVYISEFLPSPAGSDENEWIEIYNSNNFIVDISGWKFDDKPAFTEATAGKAKPFKIPQNTFIAAKNYLVFPRNATKIALNNDNDSVRFYYPEGIVIDEIKYEKSKEGYSASRKPDSTFIWTKNITPSSQNIFLSDSTNTINSTASNQSTVKKSENYFAKNLIFKANAQIVADDPRENVADIASTPENKNISAHISNAANPKTAGKLFLILTTLGIFILIWQFMKKR